jgi:hypothetical protein
MYNPILERVREAPALLTALRFSYGLAATPTQAAQARQLAPSVKELKPGIFQVGKCQVNLWRESCTCKEHRARILAGKSPRPCVHFIALYLADRWRPIYNPVEYLKTIQVKEPQPVATFCRAKLPACYPPAPEGFRVIDVSAPSLTRDGTGAGIATLENIHTGTHADAPVSALVHLVTFYE